MCFTRLCTWCLSSTMNPYCQPYSPSPRPAATQALENALCYLYTRRAPNGVIFMCSHHYSLAAPINSGLRQGATPTMHFLSAEEEARDERERTANYSAMDAYDDVMKKPRRFLMPILAIRKWCTSCWNTSRRHKASERESTYCRSADTKAPQPASR